MYRRFNSFLKIAEFFYFINENRIIGWISSINRKTLTFQLMLINISALETH